MQEEYNSGSDAGQSGSQSKPFYITSPKIALYSYLVRVKREVRSLAADMQVVILSVIIGTLAAIVYSLRILVLMERRMARIDDNILRITKRIVREEFKIEKEEKKIETALGRRRR